MRGNFVVSALVVALPAMSIDFDKGIGLKYILKYIGIQF